MSNFIDLSTFIDISHRGEYEWDNKYVYMNFDKIQTISKCCGGHVYNGVSVFLIFIDGHSMFSYTNEDLRDSEFKRLMISIKK